LRGTPFLWLLTLLFTQTLAAEVLCPPDRIDEQARVSRVVDGDTVWLTDRRKLRLIAMDTPEMGRKGRAAEPLAIRAKDYLHQLLAAQKYRISLRYDLELKDRYKRTLVHSYLSDGNSITALLLSQGLASLLIVPPNTWNFECYQRVEQRARKQRKGIWALPAFQPRSVHTLTPEDGGLRIVQGRVRSVVKSRKNIWLNIGDDFGVRIPLNKQQYFTRYDLLSFKGKRLEVRGWLVQRKGRWQMTISHPVALTVLH